VNALNAILKAILRAMIVLLWAHFGHTKRAKMEGKQGKKASRRRPIIFAANYLAIFSAHRLASA